MRFRILPLIAALSMPVPALANDWSKVDLYVSNKPATSRGDIFWTTLCFPGRPCPLTNPAGMVRDAWNVVDVAALGLPSDVSHIFVSGSLLISHANAGRFVATVSGYVNSSGWLASDGFTVTSQGLATLSGPAVAVVSETANLKAAFRAFGDTTPIDNNNSDGFLRQWYLGHSVEVESGNREPWSTWVPVKNGKFEFKYSCTLGHNETPATSACGINLTVQAYAKKRAD